MRFYIGTSGWMYGWNQDGTLKWYKCNSGLNAIELNYSFYRFPSKKEIDSWISVGTGLSWSIKVNRVITQMFKMNKSSEKFLSNFLKLFEPMDEMIDNYLFQLPPNFSAKFKDRVIHIISKFNLNEKAVIEPRNKSWFDEQVYDTFKSNGISISSIDSPIGNFYVRTHDKVYLRIHGRHFWYNYNYTHGNLNNILDRVRKLNGRKVYTFFNNDHFMLENARYFYRISRSV